MMQTSKGSVHCRETTPRAGQGRVALLKSGRPRPSVTLKAAVDAGVAAREKYDYVIVGGGTAGSVLANRLTEDGTKKVLVVEAGVRGSAIEVKVPAGLARLFKHPVLDWNLFSSLQKQLKEREIYLARGKLLGGSSCTNATLYHRGTAQDYDQWGLEGWSSRDVLDWFKRAETNTIGPNQYHGSGGAMQVESPRYDNPLHEAFFGSARVMGLADNPDFNDWSRPQAGYGEFQVTQERGERADMNRQYLQPVMQRENLQVLTGARATKIEFEKRGNVSQARAVTFATGQQGTLTVNLAAKGEVLMCAGTVQNPQLMMLSGLGPKADLQEMGLDVVADLPGVGKNLQDHPATLYAALIKPEHASLAITEQIYSSNNNIRISAILNYLFRRRGPLTTTACDHGAFLNTTGGSGDPDLQMRFVPGYALDPDGISSYVRFDDIKKEKGRWPPGITIQLLAVRPKSRGTVGLRSINPLDAPAVDLGYFTDAGGADLATLRRGLQLSRELVSKGPLAEYLHEETWPGPQRTSDQDLDDYIKMYVHSGNALVGTCRMGRSAEEGAVVDSRDMKVFGVEGLRVVDASVIPVIPGGQTGAAVVMVAEKTASLLTAKQAKRAEVAPLPAGSPSPAAV